MANVGPFSGPWMAISCQKRRPFFDNFPVISCVFHIFSPHNTTQHTPYHTHFSLFLVVFSVFPHAHSTQHTQSQSHTRTHTCTPATDRDLESGLSTTRGKTREICLKKAKSGESLAKARFHMDGQIVRLRRSGERRIEPSGGWFPPEFLSFSGKSE